LEVEFLIYHKKKINMWPSPIGFSLPTPLLSPLSPHQKQNTKKKKKTTKNTKSNYHPKRKKTVAECHLFKKGGML
jgi:hypothetical protein